MKNYCLLLALLFFLFPSCKDNCHSSVPGCCDNDAVEEQVGQGTVYLPNVFTPNFDGVNDQFFVYANDINRIISFKIFSKTGDLIYEVQNVLPNDPSIAWDGRIEGGDVQADLFTYKIEDESLDGMTKEIEGAVCSFPCGNTVEKEPAFDALANCKLGRQNNGGTFDSLIDSGEQWNCLEE